MGMVDFDLSDVGKTLIYAREALTGKKVIDPIEVAKIEADLQKLENALITGQLDINKTEAQHPSVFVAGWRPFVGWVGGFALAYVAILEPLARFSAVLAGYEGEFPAIDTTLTMQVLLGMLGIGGMRSFDKFNKTDTKTIK